MIVSRVRRTLLERGLIERGTRVLAACSGGPDSAAMLAALARLGAELGLSLQAASVDHGLRKEAARDVAIAREQAEQLGVGFHALKVEIGAERSVEAEARAARYAVLKQLAAELGASRIAVGHTLDDQAETVIMRLLRGAGVEGLAGIAPLREDGVMRPLIDCSRQQVHAYARARFARIAEDASNLDTRFERVRIRCHLLPALQEADPAVVRHLARMADDARERARSIRARAALLLERARSENGGLSLPALADADRDARQTALRLWIREQTRVVAGWRHLDQIDRAIGRKGEIWLPGGWAVGVDRGGLRCFRRF